MITWTLHPVSSEYVDDDWQGFAIVGSDGHAFLIGDEEETRGLLTAVQDGLENGRLGEHLFDNDEIFGVAYLSIAEACVMANKFDGRKYPYQTPQEQNRLRRRLQQNIRRERIWGVRRDPQGHYRIRLTAFRGWLVRQRDNL